MKELQAGGGGGEEDFNKMLMGMMSQLTNKEILYEPMKELHDKFPAWMEENRSSTGKEDLARYEEQHAMVKQIVERFERKGYSDDNDDDREYIVERMQKVGNTNLIVKRALLTVTRQMQAAGSPPPDLVGDMSAAQEALGELEGGCPTQ
jgi:peroxin-19